MKWLLVAALCSGCAADPSLCPESYRSISRGFYGEARYVDAKRQDQPLARVLISIAGYRGGFVDVRTDDRGFYEADVPPDEYRVCTDFLDVGCFTLTLGDYSPDLMRVDLRVDEGAGADWDFVGDGTCP